jgi:hypothetical protein
MATFFRGKTGGVPFPRNESEWIENKMAKGYSLEDASQFAVQKVRDDVFGAGHTLDAKGEPIETGRGSALQQTNQHKAALERSAGARAAMRSRIGYTSAVADAFDPRAGK